MSHFNTVLNERTKMNRSELLITYGHRILESNQFANAKDQKHHFRTDVASLSINVALFCIAFYQLLSLFHIKLNLATLIIAALAHDLGIIGRRENFSSNYQCLKGHPKDSVAAVREIIPEVDIRICDAISSHMFPLYPILPTSREAWILTLADKCATCTDLFRHYTVPQVSIA